MKISNDQNLIFSKYPLLQNSNGGDDSQLQKPSPAFKGTLDSFLNKSGSFMHRIEKGGFLALFLIQDFLGMTMPRTYAGFLRDKEVTGEYNIQEGFEVLGREGLTGPCMMAVAPLSLLIASKAAGGSTSVNTELIKRYGNSLKELLSSPDFDRELLKDAGKFKAEFYRKNTESILKQTLGEISEEELKSSTDYIMGQLKNYENIPKDAKLKRFFGKSSYRSQCIDNIVSHINNIKYNTSDDLGMLRKVKFGVTNANEAKTFGTVNAFEGMIKYTNDAVRFTKNLEKLDSSVAESLKHSALGKRILVNISMIAATLGVLSVLPKLYLRSNTAPGARKNQKVCCNENNAELNENVSFKGKGTGITEKLGKVIEKNKKDFVSSELEYNGHNFTHTLMAGLSLFGLITPRCMRAYSRAQVDDKGKKDLTEIWEIVIRDVFSSLSVVFAVPMLTRALVTSYEKNSGFVLMHKDRTPKHWFKTSLDLINPYSKAHVLSNSEITALYDNVNNKSKMLNFCNYIDKNGGDLQKILSKSEGYGEFFFDDELKTALSQKGADKKKSNEAIIKFVENIEENAKKFGKEFDKKSVDNMVTKLMKNASKGRSSKITAMARGLNSVPGLITTLFISPYILGWFIPRLTYKNTRRIHAKEDKMREREMKLNA